MKAAAAAQLAEIERKLQALPGEIDALRTRGAEEIAAEEQRIAGQAAAERDRLLEQTRREIDLQLRLAKRELVEHAADLVGAARWRSDCSSRSRLTIRIGWSIAISIKVKDQRPATPERTAMSLRTPPRATRKRCSTSPSRNRIRRASSAISPTIVDAMTDSRRAAAGAHEPGRAAGDARQCRTRARRHVLDVAQPLAQAAGDARRARPARAAADAARGLPRAAARASATSCAPRSRPRRRCRRHDAGARAAVWAR